MNWRAYQLLQSIIILQLGNRHIIVLIVSFDTVNIKTKLASNILLSWSRCCSGSIIDRQIKCTQFGDKLPQIDCWIQFSCSIQWISRVFFPCLNLFLADGTQFVCLFSFLDKKNYHPSIKLATTLHVVSWDCIHFLQSASRFTRDEWCKNNLDGKSNGNPKKPSHFLNWFPKAHDMGIG